MKNRTFISGNCRFSVISETLIRVEVSSDRCFVDEKTLLARRRGIPARFSVSESESRLVIETPKIRLTHINDGNFLNQENLRAEIVYQDGIVRWFYRKEHTDVPDGIFSRDGWCILEDTGTPILRGGWLENRPESHKKDFYLFAYGTDYQQVLRDLALLSGDYVLPRKEALGSWFLFENAVSAEDVFRVADEYAAYDFPLDGFMLDRALTDGASAGEETHRGYSWNKELFAEPQDFFARLSKRGLRLVLCDRPSEGIVPSEMCYEDFMHELCCNPETGETLPFASGDRNYMQAFLKHTQDRPDREGVDCVRLDCRSLPSGISGIRGQKVLPWLNALYYEHSRKKGIRGQIFGFWDGIGCHNRPLCFSNEKISGWQALDVAVKAAASYAGSGCFLRGMDIGGFRAAERDPEFYLRLLQFGVTSATVCLHDSGGGALDCRPWLWGEKNRDSMRKVFSLRSELMPYLYSSAYEGYDSQLPLVRPLYLQNPDSEEAYRHPGEYYFGDLFLAAPITEAGQGEDFTVTKEVWLPEGNWVNWFTGESFQGEASVTVFCGRDSFPLFVRAGVPVPMQPGTVRTTGEPLKNLMIRIFDCEPGNTGIFTLYEDDGTTEKYMDGECLMTDICYERLEDAVNITFLASGKSFDGLTASRNILIEICGLCEDFVCDTPKVKVAADREKNRTLIKVSKVNPRAEIHVCLRKEKKNAWY